MTARPPPSPSPENRTPNEECGSGQRVPGNLVPHHVALAVVDLARALQALCAEHGCAVSLSADPTHATAAFHDQRGIRPVPDLAGFEVGVSRADFAADATLPAFSCLAVHLADKLTVESYVRRSS